MERFIVQFELVIHFTHINFEELYLFGMRVEVSLFALVIGAELLPYPS